MAEIMSRLPIVERLVAILYWRTYGSKYIGTKEDIESTDRLYSEGGGRSVEAVSLGCLLSQMMKLTSAWVAALKLAQVLEVLGVSRPVEASRDSLSRGESREWFCLVYAESPGTPKAYDALLEPLSRALIILNLFSILEKKVSLSNLQDTQQQQHQHCFYYHTILPVVSIQYAIRLIYGYRRN